MFFKIAFRHFSRQAGYAAINIIGLAIGVACLLLAVLYWIDERQYDRFHGANRYRILTTRVSPENPDPQTTGGTGQVQGPAFAAEVPEILTWTRVLGGDVYGEVSNGDCAFKLQMLFADTAFFDVFRFPFVKGNAALALRDINSAVLTVRTAEKLFHSTDVVGKLLYLDANPSAEKFGKNHVIVAGVIENPPHNSSVQFDILFPFRYMQLSFQDENWLNAYLGTYIIVPENADHDAICRKFKTIYDKHAPRQIAEQGFDPRIQYGLQPLSDIHLNSYMGGNGWHEGGTVGESKPRYSNVLLALAFIVFLLATINYVNLSVAASLPRAREVRIRKLNGGGRLAIFGQFVGESALLCAVAYILGAGLFLRAMPAFNTLTGNQIALSQALSWWMAGGFFGVFLATVVLAGVYPAWILSAFKPVEVLYSRNTGFRSLAIGKALVVFQFATAFGLMVAMLVFFQQMRYIQSAPPGFEPRGVIASAIRGDRDYGAVKAILKNELAQQPDITAVSFGSEPSFQLNWSGNQTRVGTQTLAAHYHFIDTAFLAVMGIPLRAGRNIAAPDAREILVNETFVRNIGLKDPLGALVHVHPDYSDGEAPYAIAGVVNDFHFESLHAPYRPLAFFQNPWHSGGILVKSKPGKEKEAMTAFERACQKAIPGAVFEAEWVDDSLEKRYARDRRWQTIVSLAAALALFISCLGLFGLARLDTARRTREIGIRKVLGASAAHVVALLTRHFLRQVALGIALAVPATWYVLSRWLEGFAFRIELSWWVFVVAGATAVAVAVLTVALQGAKAAMADPVRNLRIGD